MGDRRAWLARYARALDEERVGAALSVLEETAAALGDLADWKEAWRLTLQSGCIEAASWLARSPWPWPKDRGGVRVRAVAMVAEARSSSATVTSPFRKSTGEPFKGLCRGRLADFLAAVFAPGSPALTHKEIATLAKTGEWPLFSKALKAPGVAPWGGMQACTLALDLVWDLVFQNPSSWTPAGDAASRREAFKALLAHLPEGMGSLAVRKQALAASVAFFRKSAAAGRGVSDDDDSFSNILSLYRAMGLSESDVVGAFRKGSGESWALVCLRMNSPEGFRWALRAGLDWDEHASADFRIHGSLVAPASTLPRMVVGRLCASAEKSGPGWWGLCSEELMALPEFRKGLLEIQGSISRFAWPSRGPGGAEAFDALVHKARLTSCLVPRKAAPPLAAAPVRRPRM